MENNYTIVPPEGMRAVINGNVITFEKIKEMPLPKSWEGLVLFAIIPKYKNSHNYLLVQVSRNKQDYTDFHPRSDCRDSYFLDYKGLRNRALDILTNKNTDFKLISKEDFDLKRMALLNQYQNI